MTYQDYDRNLPPGYGQQSSSMAVVSLIAGIASFIFLPVIGAIAAVITGGMAKKEIRQSGGRITGMGMANWGMILGWINIGIGLISICFAVLVFAGAISLPLCFIPFANGFNY